MKPKTKRAMTLLGSFEAVVPDVIEAMMRESGMTPVGMAEKASGIRTQVNDYLSSICRTAHDLTPRQVRTVGLLLIVLVAAAKEQEFRLSPYEGLN
jgi:hypothetical protein